jgi:uncharacterized protein YbcV (DUF1398 family)
MSQAIENLIAAQKHAVSIRPKVGGFPYLAETLRRAGISKNIWSLPSCQAIYHSELGIVVQQGTPLVSGPHDVPRFDKDALVRALRRDQAGEGTFSEFLDSSWRAGVVSYTVDFNARNVTYFGANGESYVEEYPALEMN